MDLALRLVDSYLPHTIGILVLSLLVSLLIKRFIDGAVRRFRMHERVAGTRIEQRASTLAILLNNTSMFIVWGIAFSMILSIWGVNIAPIIAGAGVVGLAVAFGAQAFIRDVISGLFIIIEDYISVGDRVEIAGKVGKVESVRLRTTTIRDEKGKVSYIIPNSKIEIISKFD